MYAFSLSLTLRADKLKSSRNKPNPSLPLPLTVYPLHNLPCAPNFHCLCPHLFLFSFVQKKTHIMALHDHRLDYKDDHMDDGCDDDEVVNLCRLSVCTSSCMYGDNSAELYENGIGCGSMSQMSIESFEGDADDEELSNEEKNYSESGFYSLPATPPRIQRKSGNKDCMSENEAKKCTRDVRKRRRRRMEGAENCKSGGMGIKMGYSERQSGGVMLIARPKGGRRSMCMHLEEVKACRDLGFELEMPSRISISPASALDINNGGNSHISSPGDDPQHVKARLKRWAQAVALASTPRPTIY